MFNNFCTPVEIRGTVEVLEIEELKAFHNNKNIKVKVRAVRRRMHNGEKIMDYDSCYIKFWASAAEYVAEHLSVGDIIYVTGELRGNYPNIDLRATKFEVLTPTEEQLELINA